MAAIHSTLGHIGQAKVTAHQQNSVTAAELAGELRNAHDIIRIALNCLAGEAWRTFTAEVRAAGLEGEGVTRANERRTLLERLT